ncbi:MAG: metalloregulator ArsR/SmtB family transcription factor [Clostridia bacterium]|nr:metalloregulator ArsR/SmtB family transcription factor [Clostridia bacterium]
MDAFELPHAHGKHLHTEDIKNVLADTERFGAVSEIFKQLSDPARVRIFWLLCHREECVVNIAALMEMSSPAVSHHLHSLTESGLIESRREGKEVHYRAADTERIRMLHGIVEQVMEVACPEHKVDYGASQEEIVRKVHDHLMEHLSERISIDDLARMFLMNTTTLKTVFKRVYGTTIAAHMRTHRLERAAALLKTTDREVTEVAKAVGYDSAARFATAFRENFGETPSEYRRHARGE